MFYLTTHSTRFIYGYTASDIWLRTILIVRKETRCCHICYSLRLQQGFFYMHHPTDRIAHTTGFVTPVVEHWLEREIAHEESRSDDPLHHERTPLPRSYMSLLFLKKITIKKSVNDTVTLCLIGMLFNIYLLKHLHCR